jgi:hypothetical protein
MRRKENMEKNAKTTTPSEEVIDLAQKCCGLIRDIAARGAVSRDRMLLCYILNELSDVLWYFDPEETTPPPGVTILVHNLRDILDQLEDVDARSESLSEPR